MRRSTTCLVGLCVLIGLAAPTWGQTLPRNHRATISPSLVQLKPRAEQAFKIVMIATRMMSADLPKEVHWSVNDIPGGNEVFGTISAEGVYRAPASLPSPREVHICADVPESANRYLWATVVVGTNPIEYKSCGTWSEPVLKDKERTQHLVDPHGIALDKDGNILIADQRGSQVVRFSQKGEFMGSIGRGQGSEPGQFNEPRIITTDTEGFIFVSDSKGDRPRIQVFSPEGEFVRIFAEKGLKPGMILRSHGMSFDPAGRLFVSDVDNMRVNVYDHQGAHLGDWGTEGLNPGQFNAPHGVFVDKSGDVFVTGYYGPTQKFNSDGDYVCGFGHGDPPDGPTYFHNMAGDRWGDVYLNVRSKGGDQGVIQKGKHLSFVKYNNNGSYVTGWTFSNPEHSETTSVIDANGRVYGLFKGSKDMGVEMFEQK